VIRLATTPNDAGAMGGSVVHWKYKLSWALALVPVLVGVVWSIVAKTPVPFIGAIFLTGVLLDGPIRDLRRSAAEEDQ